MYTNNTLATHVSICYWESDDRIGISCAPEEQYHTTRQTVYNYIGLLSLCLPVQATPSNLIGSGALPFVTPKCRRGLTSVTTKVEWTELMICLRTARTDVFSLCTHAYLQLICAPQLYIPSLSGVQNMYGFGRPIARKNFLSSPT